MRTLTTTIKRRWLAKIIAGTKKVEYREMKPYWQRRIGMTLCPFRLRLINGMSKTAPEVTVLIDKVSVGCQPGDLAPPWLAYRLHIAKVLSHRNWDKKRGIPSQ
jgi:hypothetical protein